MGVSKIPKKLIPPRKRYSTTTPMLNSPSSPSSPEPSNSETKPNSSPEPISSSSPRRIYLKPDPEFDTNCHNAHPTSVGNKRSPKSNNLCNNLPLLPESGDQRLDDECCWSSSWVGHLEGSMLTLIESDDNEPLLIHMSIDSDHQNQSLKTISEDFVDIYPDNFTKTTSSSSSSSPSSKLVGAGIKNMGNTCFMSAILQCFTHISQFVLGIRYCTHSFAPCDVKDFCIICAFHKHIDAALEPSRSVVIPTLLVENLKHFLPNYVRFQQEDAHEFMHSALEKLQVYFSNGEENIVDHIFGGEIVSMLRCRICGYSSESFEEIINLSLHIENLSTIQSILESFTMAEKIDEARCSSCNKKEVLERRYMLHRIPSVAALHLKRFKGYANSVQKLDSHVCFSMELDMQPYTSGNGIDNALLKYDLYAVVVHKGHTPNSGHYVCYVRSDTNIWHLMDDSKVSRVSEVQVLNAQAYILFYAQQGTPWFSSIVENEETDPIQRSLDSKHDFGNNGEKGDNDSMEAF